MTLPIKKWFRQVTLLSGYGVMAFAISIPAAYAFDPAPPQEKIIVNAGPYQPGDIVIETPTLYRRFLSMTSDGHYLVQDFYKGNVQIPQKPQYSAGRPILPFERCDSWHSGDTATSLTITPVVDNKTDAKRTDPYVLLDESYLTRRDNLNVIRGAFDALRLNTPTIGMMIQGDYVQWYPEGGKWTQGAFAAGLKNGVWQEWNPSGQLITRGEYQAGKRKGIWTQWSMSGQKCQEGAYWPPQQTPENHQDLRHGLWQRWHNNGQLAAQFTLERGMFQGAIQSWHANGQRDMQGQYVDNKANGVFIYWRENGNKMIESTYRLSEKNGPWKYWYESGSIHEEGQFLNGKKHGPWVYWHENGQKEKQGDYNNGRIVGRWLEWDRNGQSRPSENYGNYGVAVDAY